LTSAALTGAVISGTTYTIPIAASSIIDAYDGKNFFSSFNEQFSLTGLSAAATIGAANGMFATSMFNWAGGANSFANIATIPGFVLQANKFFLGLPFLKTNLRTEINYGC
jgi:filamentous hemagglutinin